MSSSIRVHTVSIELVGEQKPYIVLEGEIGGVACRFTPDEPPAQLVSNQEWMQRKIAEAQRMIDAATK